MGVGSLLGFGMCTSAVDVDGMSENGTVSRSMIVDVLGSGA